VRSTWIVKLSGLFLCQVFPSNAGGTEGLSVFRSAFSREECERIVAHFEARSPAERDVRVHAGVSRTNHFDKAPAESGGVYDWIFARILALLGDHPTTPSERALWGFDPRALRSASELVDSVDFVLLHEFHANDFFDTHVDTKPEDGTGRTVNINVMLSPPEAYAGGELRVGTSSVRASQGDMCLYPAALPHKVEDITGGKRHTLVIAVRVPEAQRAACGYWQLARANHERLRAQLPGMPKVHLVRAEYLAALGDEDAADEAFGEAYACTAEASQYAEHFHAEGMTLLKTGDGRGALKHFTMAARVDPAAPAHAARRDAVAKALADSASG
jgi:hypothetical protein